MTKHPHSDTKVWRHAAMFPPRVDDPPQGQDRGSSLRRDSTLPTQYLAPIATSETVTVNMPKGPPSSDPSPPAERRAVGGWHRNGCVRHGPSPGRLTGIGPLTHRVG
jgi:hypothetical protein